MLTNARNIFFKSKDAKEITINSLWSIIGTIVSKGLAFAGWVIVANYLGKTLNGEIGIIRSTINLFLVFVGSGLGLTATRYISEFKGKSLQKVGKVVSLTLVTTFVFSLIIAGLFFIFSPWLAQTLNAASLSHTLKLGSGLLFFGALNGCLTGCLEGFQLFKKSAIINILQSIALFSGLYIGALSNDVNNTFLGFLAATVFHFILQAFVLKRELRIQKIQLDFHLKEEFKILTHFTIPAILSGAMVVPFKWLAEAILVNQKTGYAEMGLFSAIILFQTLLYMLANTLNTPLITLMSKKSANLKIDKLSLILPWAIGIFGALPFISFPEFFGFVFGNEYIQDDNFFQTYIIILLFTVVMLYKQGISRIMILNELMWFSFLSNMIWGVSLTAVFYYLKEEGAVGLAIAYLCAYVINILVVLPLYLKKKMIPKFLLVSPYAISIWITLVAVAGLNYFLDLSLFLRIILVLLSAITISFFFYKLFKFPKNAL